MNFAPFLFAGYALRVFVSTVVLVVLFSQATWGGEFHNALSLQGFTGLLNTPNAEVTGEGDIYLLFSNQREGQFPPRNAREESYLLSVGFFSFAELGGRLTDAPRAKGAGITDLSANFKVNVPFIPKGRYLPSIAFGMQDIGGGAKNLQTTYLVATEELWRFRFSVGYGAGPDRMKGAFGGVEIKAFDWLYLIGENDARETNVGARLVTPEIFNIPVNLQVTAKSSLDHRPGNLEFGLGMRFPLGLGRARRAPAQEEGDREIPRASAEPVTPAEQGISHAVPNNVFLAQPAVSATGDADRLTDSRAELERLTERLAAAGFQNIRVGTKDRLLVVEYENSRFNANELDALGVVAGIVVDGVASRFDELSLVVKKKGMRILNFSAPFGCVRRLLSDGEASDDLCDALLITTDVHEDRDVVFLDDAKSPSSWLKSSVVLYPGLKTFVGTEVSSFDYLLSLKIDYYLNVWKGAVANVRWDVPVAWSKNFDNGEVFRAGRTISRMERAMLFQAVKPAPDLMINLGGGMVLHDQYGTLNEAVWSPGDGPHRFSIKQAYVKGRDSLRNEVYLGVYRYYFDPLDLFVIGTGGKFFDKDKGFSIELKRFFGDTAFSVYYKNSRTPAQEQVQVGGVQVAFPLTPRRDMKPYLVQVRGNDEWTYAQEVKIVSPGSSNAVGTSIGVNPQPPFNVEHIFYNRDRLSEPYIRKHLYRLRDAYLAYRQK